jgi:hypothetical protein
MRNILMLVHKLPAKEFPDLEESDIQKVLHPHAAVLVTEGLRTADHLVNHIKEVSNTVLDRGSVTTIL